jgi:hypothetical protein
VPAKDLRHPCGGGFGIADGDIGMFENGAHLLIS